MESGSSVHCVCWKNRDSGTTNNNNNNNGRTRTKNTHSHRMKQVRKKVKKNKNNNTHTHTKVKSEVQTFLHSALCFLLLSEVFFFFFCWLLLLLASPLEHEVEEGKGDGPALPVQFRTEAQLSGSEGDDVDRATASRRAFVRFAHEW